MHEHANPEGVTRASSGVDRSPLPSSQQERGLSPRIASSPVAILGLQRIVGNHAVLSLVGQLGEASRNPRPRPMDTVREPNETAAPFADEAVGPAVQRQQANTHDGGPILQRQQAPGRRQVPAGPPGGVTTSNATAIDSVFNRIRNRLGAEGGLYNKRKEGVRALERRLTAPEPPNVADQMLLNLATAALSVATSGLGGIILGAVASSFRGSRVVSAMVSAASVGPPSVYPRQPAAHLIRTPSGRLIAPHPPASVAGGRIPSMPRPPADAISTPRGRSVAPYPLTSVIR